LAVPFVGTRDHISRAVQALSYVINDASYDVLAKIVAAVIVIVLFANAVPSVDVSFNPFHRAVSVGVLSAQIVPALAQEILTATPADVFKNTVAYHPAHRACAQAGKLIVIVVPAMDQLELNQAAKTLTETICNDSHTTANKAEAFLKEIIIYNN
jgi:hypothetical protein